LIAITSGSAIDRLDFGEVLEFTFNDENHIISTLAGRNASNLEEILRGKSLSFIKERKFVNKPFIDSYLNIKI
jgi:hypothetical protein